MSDSSSEEGERDPCFFWYRTKSECQVFRLAIDRMLFPDITQLARHLGNQCGLIPCPGIFGVRDKGGFTEIEHMKRIESGAQYIIVPSGITPKSAAPEFFNRREKVARVESLFGSWDELLEAIGQEFEARGVGVLFTRVGDLSSNFNVIAEKFGLAVGSS